MNLYHNEPVLGVCEGRLVPPDPRYPDCRCTLLLTELCLYVIEDNYDGTYTEHFVIPIEDVLCIERWAQMFSSSGVESTSVEPRGLSRFFYRIVGPLAIARRGPQRARSAKEYVRVRYRNEDAREVFLHLSEAEDPHAIARSLEKFRERWGMQGDFI